MARAIVGLLTALGMTAVEASAAWGGSWQHQVYEDAFNGDAQMVLSTDDLGYGIGFRCRGKDDLALVYMMPERVTAADVSAMTAVKPALLVIVDEQPKVSLAADVEQATGTELLMAYSEGLDVESILDAAQAAKRRMAVAFEIGGKPFHSRTFGLKGFSRAIDKLTGACGLRKEDRAKE